MANEPATLRARNGQRTITLPMTEEQYAEIIDDPQRFRDEWLDPFYADCPELFPPGFEKGYEMNGRYHSKRQDLDIRRLKLQNGEQYQVRPSFVLPMMVGRVEEVEAGLFLRKFWVPYWAIVRLFGRNATFWYRERAKNLKEQFFEIGKRVWDVYYSETKTVMSQRVRRLRDWATKHLSGIVREKVLDLCAKQSQWSLWYEEGCEEAHTTSNMLDRLMRQQDGYFDRGQHFHGDLESANLRSRSWAILHNDWPWSPESVVANKGAACPAERLNGKRYADNWLENLLIAASLGGTKESPLKIRKN